MIKILIPLSVNEASERINSFLIDKGLTVFADIDHRVNASAVDLEMPDARTIIFGNPLAGTALMKKDIFMSFDLPLRLSVVDKEGDTYLLHNTADNYADMYDVGVHPVLDKITALFSTMNLELTK